MDSDNLRYVLAIFRCGTKQKVGRQFGVAHTTVGLRVRALDEDLGVGLFDRTTDGFVVTNAGEELVASAQSFEDEILTFQLGLWMLTLTEALSNRRVRAFLDHMADALRPYRPLLAGDAPESLRVPAASTQ